MRIPFDRYKDEELENIDSAHLREMIEILPAQDGTTDNRPLIKEIQNELNFRKKFLKVITEDVS